MFALLKQGLVKTLIVKPYLSDQTSRDFIIWIYTASDVTIFKFQISEKRHQIRDHESVQAIHPKFYELR